VYDVPIFPRTEQGAGVYREALGGDDFTEQHFMTDNGCDQQKLLGTPVLIWDAPPDVTFSDGGDFPSPVTPAGGCGERGRGWGREREEGRGRERGVPASGAAFIVRATLNFRLKDLLGSATRVKKKKRRSSLHRASDTQLQAQGPSRTCNETDL